VTAVSDGFLDGNLEVMRNVDLAAAHKILADDFRPARRTSVNTFLVQSAGRRALIDTGCGAGMAATGGQLLRNLSALGVQPDHIDTVLLSHLHPDHVGGLVNPNGAANFLASDIVMHENEYQHWHSDAEMAKADERTSRFFQVARNALAPYARKVRLCRDGEVFPGVTAVHSAGHTPGHCAFLITSGEEKVMIWGDTVHVPEVQTAFPDAGMSFDSDVDQAAASRKRMFERVSRDSILVAGMHTHFPGFGRLAVNPSGGFRLVPEAWQHVL
jgi:glyoxylase-like metal-dependent hydrolase (beta-lactamase superfamily II)